MSPSPREDEPTDSARMPLGAVALARSMDFKIPVWGVLCLLAGLAYWLITMNVQQQQILATMGELKSAVQSGNSQLAVNSGEIAIMKFRMEKVESDHARTLTKGMP